MSRATRARGPWWLPSRRPDGLADRPGSQRSIMLVMVGFVVVVGGIILIATTRGPIQSPASDTGPAAELPVIEDGSNELDAPSGPAVVRVSPDMDLQGIIDAAKRGSIIQLHEGVYQPVTLLTGLTLEAFGDGEAIVTGADGAWDAGIWIQEAADVTVRGLTVSGNTLGIYFENATGTLIEDNFITDNAYGLEIHGETTGSVIRNNRIEGNSRFLDPSRSAGGMNLFETHGGIVVSDNMILDNDSVGIEVYGMDDAVIERNVIAGSADAIETGAEAGGDCRNNQIIRNLIYHTARRSVERGIWLRCMSESIVAHNTIDGMDDFGIGISGRGSFSGPVDDLQVVNNLIVNGRAFWLSERLPPSVVIDFNGVQACTDLVCPDLGQWLVSVADAHYSNLADLQARTPYMANALEGDPSFVSRDDRDYELMDGSLAINRGTRLGFPFLGTAPDLGWVEKR